MEFLNKIIDRIYTFIFNKTFHKQFRLLKRILEKKYPISVEYKFYHIFVSCHGHFIDFTILQKEINIIMEIVNFTGMHDVDIFLNEVHLFSWTYINE